MKVIETYCKNKQNKTTLIFLHSMLNQNYDFLDTYKIIFYGYEYIVKNVRGKSKVDLYDANGKLELSFQYLKDLIKHIESIKNSNKGE